MRNLVSGGYLDQYGRYVPPTRTEWQDDKILERSVPVQVPNTRPLPPPCPRCGDHGWVYADGGRPDSTRPEGAGYWTWEHGYEEFVLPDGVLPCPACKRGAERAASAWWRARHMHETG